MTNPASSSTRRCLVIAWRVMSKPAASFAIDSGPSSPRRETRPRRVRSPIAKKTSADAAMRGAPPRLCLTGKVFLDERHLHAPAGLVGGEGPGAALERNRVEARLDHGQEHAIGALLESEDDERGR